MLGGPEWSCGFLQRSGADHDGRLSIVTVVLRTYRVRHRNCKLLQACR
jgi:hypothetical protein